MRASFLFVITPAGELAGDALGEFEAAARRELEAVKIFLRSVSGQRSTLYRESSPEGRPRFLWLLEVDFVAVGADGGASVAAKAVNEAKEKLKDRATVSAGFKLTDLSD
jgi:hypothetical protein